MKRSLFYLSLLGLTMLLSCEKEQKKEEEEFIPNSCSAELFYENGQIGFRVLKAEGSMDIAAALDISFEMTGEAEYYDYDFKTEQNTKKTKEFKTTVKGHPSDRAHIATGEVMNIIDIKELISSIEGQSASQWIMNDGKLDVSSVPAYTTNINIVGNVTFYRSKEQMLKDQYAAVTGDNPGAAFSLYDPVECDLTMSLNANMLLISGEIYPAIIPITVVQFNGKLVMFDL